jgi:uncharacterized DUF497 family protein
VDTGLELRGQTFVWDSEKAAINLRKHNVNFQEACEVFFDPFFRLVDATPRTKHEKEQLDTPSARDCSLLCMWCARKKRSASFRPGPQRRKREKSMSMNKRLKKRFEKPRPMSSISIRMPEDVLENLKEVSTALGFSGYQPLIRFYIGQSLRKDLARIEGDPVAIMADSLRRHGVADAVIEEAVAEATKG